MAKGTRSGNIGRAGKGSGRHYGSSSATARDAAKSGLPAEAWFEDPVDDVTVENAVATYDVVGAVTTGLLAAIGSGSLNYTVSGDGSGSGSCVIDPATGRFAIDDLALAVGDNILTIDDDSGDDPQSISETVTITREA